MPLRQSFQFSLLITLLVITGVTLLCCLGFWQLSRAEQKEEIQSQLQIGQEGHPLTTKALLENNDLADFRYHRVQLNGHFLNDRTILLDNKTNNGQPGYYVYVPFTLNNENVILVNRGWIPLGPSRSVLPATNAIKGEVTIEGYLDFAYRNPFIKNALESKTIDWPLRLQELDVSLLHSLIGKNIHTMLVTLDSNSPYAFVAPNRPGSTMSPARHRGYAFQWFALAVTLLGLSLFSYKKARGKI